MIKRRCIFYRNIQQKRKKKQSLIVTRQRHENDRLKTLLYLQSGKLRSQQFFSFSIFFEKIFLIQIRHWQSRLGCKNITCGLVRWNHYILKMKSKGHCYCIQLFWRLVDGKMWFGDMVFIFLRFNMFL